MRFSLFSEVSRSRQMCSKQAKNGSFVEHGRVYDKEMQGGVAKTTTGQDSCKSGFDKKEALDGQLTAFVLIAILQEKKSSQSISKNDAIIAKAVDFIYR